MSHSSHILELRYGCHIWSRQQQLRALKPLHCVVALWGFGEILDHAASLLTTLLGHVTEHVDQILASLTFHRAVVECCQECQDRIDRILMPVVERLEGSGLSVEGIVLLLELSDHVRDVFLVLLQLLQLTSHS